MAHARYSGSCKRELLRIEEGCGGASAHIQVVCSELEFVVSLYKSTVRTFSSVGTAGTGGLGPLFNPSRRQGGANTRKRGERGRRLRSRIPQRRRRATQHRFASFDGGQHVRGSFIPNGRAPAHPHDSSSTSRRYLHSLQLLPPNSANATGNTFGADDAVASGSFSNDPFCAGEEVRS